MLDLTNAAMVAAHNERLAQKILKSLDRRYRTRAFIEHRNGNTVASETWEAARQALYSIVDADGEG